MKKKLKKLQKAPTQTIPGRIIQLRDQIIKTMKDIMEF